MFQEALDCSYPEEKDGCRGGWYTSVWRYIQSAGRLAAMTDIPYFPAGFKVNPTVINTFLFWKYFRNFNVGFPHLMKTIENAPFLTFHTQLINVAGGKKNPTE